MRSEFSALRHLSLLQFADALRTRKEIMQKKRVRRLKSRMAGTKNMIDFGPRKRKGNRNDCTDDDDVTFRLPKHSLYTLPPALPLRMKILYLAATSTKLKMQSLSI